MPGAPEPGEFTWDAYSQRKCTIAVATAPDAAATLEDICRQGRGQLKSIDAPFVIIGQELVQRLCKQCRRPHELSAEDQRQMDLILSEHQEPRFPQETGRTFFEAVGCEACRQGHSGMLALQEYLEVSPQLLDPEVRESAGQIRRKAIRAGMSSLPFQAPGKRQS